MTMVRLTREEASIIIEQALKGDEGDIVCRLSAEPLSQALKYEKEQCLLLSIQEELVSILMSMILSKKRKMII